jgi:hypothetical protein
MKSFLIVLVSSVVLSVVGLAAEPARPLTKKEAMQLAASYSGLESCGVERAIRPGMYGKQVLAERLLTRAQKACFCLIYCGLEEPFSVHPDPGLSGYKVRWRP